VPGAAAEFSSSAALSVLRQACQQTGHSSDGAELLRIAAFTDRRACHIGPDLGIYVANMYATRRAAAPRGAT